MHEQAAWLTEFVNHHLGHVALALLAVLHIQPSHPELPIPQRVVMAVVAVIIGTSFALVLRSRLAVEKPGGMQQVAAMLGTSPSRFGSKDLLEHHAHQVARPCAPLARAVAV